MIARGIIRALGIFSKGVATPRLSSALLGRSLCLPAAQYAKDRLATFELLPQDQNTESFQQRMKSAKVFYDAKIFANNLEGDQPYSLQRAVTKVAAADVEASRYGEMADGSAWPGAEFFMQLKSGDPRGLSPDERIQARKKIIASRALISRFGGYPANSMITTLRKPYEAYIFTMAGMQFENAKLDYKTCIVDAYNHPEKYQALQKEFASEKNELLPFEYIPLKTGLFRYIQRDASTGNFTTGFSLKNAILLHRDTYFKTLVEDFTLLFASAEKMTEGNKKMYFKLPLIGMGYFARIEGCYDIRNYLIPIFLSALRRALEKQTFKHLHTIEIPIFEEETAQIVDVFFRENSFDINNIKVIFTPREDILDFTDVDSKEYDLCVLNPGDANSFPGNEIGLSKNGPTSVESAIGNNTDIRYVQNHLLNPNITQRENWIGVAIEDQQYHYTNNEQHITPRP
ncbi:MAG: hypothetical protein SFW66_09635 [Gammaproteobacteria bacterium]|nr:hypothetical protein [Gammaproteobacteria bacterium]